MKNWKLLILIIPISLLILWGVLSKYVHGTETANYNSIDQNYLSNNIPIDSILNKISTEDISKSFPFRLIAENVKLTNYENQKFILDFVEKKDSNQLSTIQEYLFIALSDSLLKNFQKKLDFEDLNTLTSLTNEVTSLYHYSQFDKKNSIVYEALFDYWMQFINQELEIIAQKKYWDKYSFEYRYISAICQQYNYNPSTGLNSTEKVLNNLAENKYGYLYYRFILRTTVYQKLGIAIAISILLFSLLFTIHSYFKKLK